jgi:hypothetical protein
MRPREHALAGTGVFGKQSPGPGHCGPLGLGARGPSPYAGRPFSRSYGAKLPSSLAWGLPPTSVCSTRPPASVCGTGAGRLASGFSRRSGLGPFGRGRSPRLTLAPRSSPRRICLPGLPTGLEGHVVTPGPTPPRPRITVTPAGGAGIWTGCPSPAPPGLGLGPPHPQRISLAAEPSGIRWGRFARPSRYSCRHSHSPTLHLGSRLGFSAVRDAPLPRSPRGNHPRLRRRA